MIVTELPRHHTTNNCCLGFSNSLNSLNIILQALTPFAVVVAELPKHHTTNNCCLGFSNSLNSLNIILQALTPFAVVVAELPKHHTTNNYCLRFSNWLNSLNIILQACSSYWPKKFKNARMLSNTCFQTSYSWASSVLKLSDNSPQHQRISL